MAYVSRHMGGQLWLGRQCKYLRPPEVTSKSPVSGDSMLKDSIASLGPRREPVKIDRVISLENKSNML